MALLTEPFTSNTFNLPTSLYLRAVVGRLLSRYGLWLALPFLLLLVIGVTVDLRYFVVAWMVPCVIYPMLMLSAYYSIMLRPQMRILAFDRRVTYTPAGDLIIECLHRQKADVEEDSEPDERPLPPTITIRAKDIEAMYPSGGLLKFVIADGAPCHLHFVHVPEKEVKSHSS